MKHVKYYQRSNDLAPIEFAGHAWWRAIATAIISVVQQGLLLFSLFFTLGFFALWLTR